ncbi:MAG: shikimate kinase [Bernardetiaceae bacterium]|nr:shikimate kinase [Bernardetiaceae bacterium]
MIPLRIYLVGLPGSGKTTMATMLANRLVYQPIDLDDLVQQAEGLSIPEIFAQHGEDYFRQKEKEALKRTFAMSRVVVATGGGTPCFGDNMAQINKNGLAVFLNIPLAVIAGRLGRQAGQRPLLHQAEEDEDLVEQLKALYKKRFSFYDQAEVSVSGQDLNADYVYNKMRQYLEENQD